MRNKKNKRFIKKYFFFLCKEEIERDKDGKID